MSKKKSSALHDSNIALCTNMNQNIISIYSVRLMALEHNYEKVGVDIKFQFLNEFTFKIFLDDQKVRSLMSNLFAAP